MSPDPSMMMPPPGAGSMMGGMPPDMDMDPGMDMGAGMAGGANPLLSILMQLLAPSIQAACSGPGMPPAGGGGGGMASLGDAMQPQPSQPPTPLY